MSAAMSEDRSAPDTDLNPSASPAAPDLADGGSHSPEQRAEAAERRLAFLAEVSSVLGASLDYETTLSDLARLAVPFLADWCIVYLIEDDTRARRAAVTHANPEDAELVEELKQFLAPDPAGRHPALEAVRSGRSVMLSVLTDEILRVIARDKSHLETLRKMQIRSAICTPLMIQGRLQGCLLFMTSHSGVVYGAEDLRLAEDLTARAALAVENARLYLLAQEARSTVESLNSRLQRSIVETHHRVKNNLQVIAAMIDARLMDDREPVTEQDLRRLASNVRALSTVHDTLTQQARDNMGAEAVSARAVLGRLLTLIQQASPANTFFSDLCDCRLTVRQGTALALVVNELVSNAVKYGKSVVHVTMGSRESRCTLTVADDGAGFPPDFDQTRSANTGLVLVDMLSSWDLAGSVEYANQSDSGAIVTVTFPVEDGDCSDGRQATAG